MPSSASTPRPEGRANPRTWKPRTRFDATMIIRPLMTRRNIQREDADGKGEDFQEEAGPLH